MAPKLRVLISSPSSPSATTPLPVNSPTPTPLKTDGFDGTVQVWVKGFEGEDKAGDGHEYFGERTGMTYAIVVRGRFLEEVDADDLLFGNTFERPIRDSLPWGTSIATRAMHYVEPTLELDLYADKPWALSYALASMNHLSMTKEAVEGHFVNENATERLTELYSGDDPIPEGGDEKARAAARKRWMSSKDHRKVISINKGTFIGLEFCNGYLDFNTLSLTLPAQFNMSFPLLKYWDGQPVTYTCQRRGPDGKMPGGKVFWQVAFEIVDEEARKDLEKRGGTAAGKTDAKSGVKESQSKESAAGKAVASESSGGDLSDDVD